jgi:spore coat protein A
VKPELGSTEIWELVNDTHHTHPIHLHLVSFEVLDREHHDGDHGPQPPHPNERGGKDVVRVNPNETVRIAVKFGDFPGQFPFHCHILEHEEHDMMRSFKVVPGRSDGPWGDDDGHWGPWGDDDGHWSPWG